MRITHRWVETSPIDGLPVEMRRAEFATQGEQVRFLRELVKQYRGLHTISALARDVTFRQMNAPLKNKAAQAVAVADWVQQMVSYVNEGDETFQTPLATLRFRWGDCDDFTTLIASLLESMGIPVELVAIGWPEPQRLFGSPITARWVAVLPRMMFRHIFPRAVVPVDGGRVVRVPLDATLDAPVSWLTDPIELARSRGVTPTTLVL